MQNSVKVIEETFKKFGKTFGRKQVFIEEFMLKGADYVLVTFSSLTTQAKAAVRKLREAGHKIGLLKLRVLRPFPKDKLVDLLKGVKAIGVVDRDISPGEGGIVFHEVKSALYEMKKRPIVSGFITGLGGKEVPFEEFDHMFKQLKKTVQAGVGVVEVIETTHDKQLVKKKLKEAMGYEVEID
jgi:pyruvate ferredoxin oxidoreductase alpha subunit